MTSGNAFSDKARQAVGYLKFKLGKATGNRKMQAGGGKDMGSGKASELGHQATRKPKP